MHAPRDELQSDDSSIHGVSAISIGRMSFSEFYGYKSVRDVVTCTATWRASRPGDGSRKYTEYAII
jgi:hypothetical protein